jgi:hypothetical protein
VCTLLRADLCWLVSVLLGWCCPPSTTVVGSATLAGVGFNTLGMAQQTQQTQQQQSQQQQQQQQSQQQQSSQQQQTLAAVAATYGNSSLGTIGSPAVLGPLSTGITLFHPIYFFLEAFLLLYFTSSGPLNTKLFYEKAVLNYLCLFCARSWSGFKQHRKERLL